MIVTTTKPSLDEQLSQWSRLLRSESRKHARRMGLEADDIYAETQLLAARGYERYDPSLGGFSTWLLWRCREAASRLHRARCRSVRASLSVSLPLLGDGDRVGDLLGHMVVLCEDDPSEIAAQNERLEKVRKALRELEPAQLQAVAERLFRDDTELAPEWSDGKGECYRAAITRLRELLAPLNDTTTQPPSPEGITK